MNNLLETFEKKQIEKLTAKKRIPAFRAGDTIKITIKIIEGDKSRLQAFEGICISRKNNSVNSNFTLRKLSHGEGVERVFPLFSPIIERIEVVRKGDVRRAKLYYLRDRTGKKARIADRDRGEELDQYEFIDEPSTEKKSDDILEKESNTLSEDEKNIKKSETKPEEKTAETITEKAEQKTDEKKS
tara:strand:- start:15295 stop:15852 length:558 start_codon:yes stop_codon:yes gene_type:complete